MPKPQEQHHNDDGPRQPRPFWSGTIAFGLVNIPVSLFVAHRGARIALRLVDAQGTPLKRRYFCSVEDIPLAGDDIERGYEVDEGHFVSVTDEELNALEPEKSREIDLSRFVPLAQIDPIYFERAYFLAPDEGASKAYRLLAHTLEQRRRAGIATFVMRGKAYLVAIIGERGLLRAETLRFVDEVRSPEAVGLPEPRPADPGLVREIKYAMAAIGAKTFDRDSLSDDQRQALEALIRRKLASGRDVLYAPEEGDTEDEEEEGADVIDLMRILKQRLEQPDAPPAQADRPAYDRRRTRRTVLDTRRSSDSELRRRSKSELYAAAQALDIEGRSHMSKDELIDAIRRVR